MITHALASVRSAYRLTREEGGERREQKVAHERPILKKREHTSVMTREVLDLLTPQKGDVMLDATGGVGGHSEALLKSAPGTKLFVLDADLLAVEKIKTRLSHFGERVEVIEANFKDCGTLLKRHGAKNINKAVFDLGWNSTQLLSGRGFSFMHDEPLSMSYGERPASGLTWGACVLKWTKVGLKV